MAVYRTQREEGVRQLKDPLTVWRTLRKKREGGSWYHLRLQLKGREETWAGNGRCTSSTVHRDWLGAEAAAAVQCGDGWSAERLVSAVAGAVVNSTHPTLLVM